MISNCKLYRINKRISNFPCLSAGRSCCCEVPWKKDVDLEHQEWVKCSLCLCCIPPCSLWFIFLPQRIQKDFIQRAQRLSGCWCEELWKKDTDTGTATMA